MTGWQEARGALVEEIALLSRGWESNPELRAMRQARDAIDALSARLAQKERELARLRRYVFVRYGE